MSSAKTTKNNNNRIAVNRKATHEFFIEQRFEAGMVLQGWEVKSLRNGKANLSDTYVRIIKDEAWVLGMNITPLNTASTHVKTDSTRVRKLLLNRRELDTLIGAVERKGYTLVAMSMYWKQGKAKLEIGLGKGKKNYDKRADEKNRDWNRQKARILKSG
jgi:SsrA-binding protein